MLNFETFLEKYEGIYFLISNENGDILYPKSVEELQKFKTILSCPVAEEGLYLHKKCFFEYNTQIMIDGQELYTVESLKDVTKFENESIIAKTDVVTNLNGKRLTFEKLDAFIDEATFLERPLACAIGDADLFKNINDKYGHVCGDEMLRSLGQILHNSTRHKDFRGMHVLRGKDVVGRIGGEEFLIVLNNVTLLSAYNIINNIRKCIEKSHIVYENEIIPSCTMSFGVYHIDTDILKEYQNKAYDAESKRSDILKKCDEALYISKKEGRNRVTIYGKSCDEILDDIMSSKNGKKLELK